MNILKKLIFCKNKLNNFEENLFNNLFLHLNDDGKKILKDQLTNIKKIDSV